MRAILFALIIWCATPAFACHIGDLADVPPALRTENWLGKRWCEECQTDHYGGSCVHASFSTVLYYHGLDDMGDWWRQTYEAGEYADRMVRRVRESGLPFAYTDTGSVEFLEWCSRNRLPCIIWWKQSHCCTIVDLNDEYAVIIDNNHPGEYEYVPRNEFIHRWQNWYDGFALTVVRPPPPPTPIPWR